MRRVSRSIDALARLPWRTTGLLILGLAIAAIACSHVPPLVPLVVLVVPTPLAHHIGGWGDDDLVCVAVLPVHAVYVQRRCLSMGAIRAVILGARVADDQAAPQ